jgi:3-methyladenine DNA glycosylase AlkD
VAAPRRRGRLRQARTTVAAAVPRVVELLLAACANNLVSSDRFAHTGPGWLLRELSRSHPDQVARFVDAHPELSGEAARMATARLRPGPYRRR